MAEECSNSVLNPKRQKNAHLGDALYCSKFKNKLGLVCIMSLHLETNVSLYTEYTHMKGYPAVKKQSPVSKTQTWPKNPNMAQSLSKVLHKIRRYSCSILNSVALKPRQFAG